MPEKYFLTEPNSPINRLVRSTSSPDLLNYVYEETSDLECVENRTNYPNSEAWKRPRKLIQTDITMMTEHLRPLEYQNGFQKQSSIMHRNRCTGHIKRLLELIGGSMIRCFFNYLHGRETYVDFRGTRWIAITTTL